MIVSNRGELDEDATVVSNPECILRDGHQISDTSDTATPVVNPPIAPQSLEAALKEVAVSNQRVESGDTLDGFADKPVSEERPASTIPFTRSCSTVWLEDAMRDQIVCISAVLENAVVRLLDNEGQATELSPHNKVMAAIQTVASRTVANETVFEAF